MSSRLRRRHFLGSLGVPLSGMLASRAGAAEQYTLRFAVPQAATGVVGQTALKIAADIRRRTNGQLNIEVYPNAQLATQEAVISSLSSGVIDFAIHTTNFLEPLLPHYQVLGMPFLFKNSEAGHRVLDGPLGQELLAELETTGVLGYGWTGSMRQMFTVSKTIATPEDMKGARIRMVGGAVGFATYQALGASAVVIDTAETLVALQQHVVEGVDTIVDGFTTLKFYTVAKHANMTNHIFSINMILGSKRKIEALPAPFPRIIREEARRNVPFWRSLILRQTADEIAFLKSNGVVVTETQFNAFRKAMDPVYAAYEPKLGGNLLERALRAAGTA